MTASFPRHARLFAGSAMFTVLVVAAGLAAVAAAPQAPPAPAAGAIAVTLDASKTGAKIDRQLFGQFAEHLGKGIYEGVWVGPTPPSEHRGIRNDVVTALKAIKVPTSGGGGCFADEYHWRTASVTGLASRHAQPELGRRPDRTRSAPEFLDFIDQIGASLPVVDVGSGTPAEAADCSSTSPLGADGAAKEAPQRPAAPYKIAILGIATRTGMAGNMSADTT